MKHRNLAMGPVGAIFLMLSASGFGQTAPSAQKTTAAAPDEPIVLSPFVINTDKDHGYLAADVISAGSLSTNLLRTPADLTVITRDLLDDLGVISIQEAQAWLPSSDPYANSTNETDFGTNVSFRGLTASTNTRNFFRQGFAPSEISTERVEGARGANGILYGDSTFGGNVNITTKRASFGRNFETVRLQADSFGSRRVTLDANHVAGSTLAVRINAEASDGKLWYDHSFNKRYGVHFASTYKPWRNGELRLDLETAYTDRTNGRPDILLDQTSAWDGTPVTGRMTSNPNPSTGIRRRTTDYWVFNPSFGVLNFRDFGFSASVGANTFQVGEPGYGPPVPIANFPNLPSRKFTAQNHEMHINAHRNNASLAFEQRWSSGLVLEVSGNTTASVSKGTTTYFTNVYRDVNSVLPNGQPNPNFGKFYSENSAGYNPIRTQEYTTGWRVGAAYPLEFRGITQQISAVVQWREHISDFEAQQYYRLNAVTAANGNLDTNQTLRWIRYWDETALDQAPPESTAIDKFGYIDSRNFFTDEDLRSMQLNSVGEYFSGKLTSILGVRRDVYKAYQTNIINPREVGTGRVINNSYFKGNDAKATTTSIGATYFPVKSVGAYLFRSEGFLPAIRDEPQLDGSDAVNLAKSVSVGYGLRFNFFRGKLVGSLGRYDATEKDKFVLGDLRPFNNIWVAMGLPEKQLNVPRTQYTDSLQLKSTGWEADLTANLSALRLSMNMSFPDTEQTNSRPGTRRYYDQNIATWRAAAQDTSRPLAERNVINNNIAAIETIISGAADGRPLTGRYDYRINVFGSYTIPSGPLKKLRLSAGMNIYGRKIIGNEVGKSFDYIYDDAYCIATASIGYGWKVHDYPFDLQLNVSNLLDYSDPIYRGVTAYNGVAYRNTFFYETPRMARLTATLRF